MYRFVHVYKHVCGRLIDLIDRFLYTGYKQLYSSYSKDSRAGKIPRKIALLTFFMLDVVS